MAKLTLLIGESGSGKTTKANELLKQAQESNQKLVRVNRDNIREMLCGKGSSWDTRFKYEQLVKDLEKFTVAEALINRMGVLVDDLNLSSKTQNNWKHYVQGGVAGKDVEFEVLRMDTPFEECVRRDSLRQGRERVGRAVIERQFLSSGRANFGTKPIILCDIDGTLANSDGVRSPYDETQVLLDEPYDIVVDWVNTLSIDHTIVLVSGRHCSCGEDTIKWLDRFKVPFDHFLCRNTFDNRPDNIIKLEILDGMLKCGVTLDQIKFVLDDRPKVIEAWKSRGLTVYPVRGAVEPF